MCRIPRELKRGAVVGGRRNPRLLLVLDYVMHHGG